LVKEITIFSLGGKIVKSLRVLFPAACGVKWLDERIGTVAKIYFFSNQNA
jgi:hypothetical protein